MTTPKSEIQPYDINGYKAEYDGGYNVIEIINGITTTYHLNKEEATLHGMRNTVNRDHLFHFAVFIPITLFTTGVSAVIYGVFGLNNVTRFVFAAIATAYCAYLTQLFFGKKIESIECRV